MGKMCAHAQSFPAWQALHPKQPCIHQHGTSQAPLVHSVCSSFGFQVKKKYIVTAATALRLLPSFTGDLQPRMDNSR